MSKILNFKTVFLTLLLFSSHLIVAQVKVELSGGVNINDISFSAKNRINTKYTAKKGNYVKAAVSFPLNNTFEIYTGISYLSKNYKYERTGEYFSGQYTNYNTKYINIPILISISPFSTFFKGNKFDFNILGGTYVGYWTSLKRDGNNYVITGVNIGEEANTISDFLPSIKHQDSYDFDKNENQFNRVDYGLQFSSKLSYQLAKKIGIFVEYSYLYGLSDNTKNQERKTSHYYYTTSNLGLGLSYQF